MLKRTLRELELEQEVSRLNCRVQELEYKLNYHSSRPVTGYSNADPVLEIAFPPQPTLRMVSSVESEWTPTGGYKVHAWARSKDQQKLSYSYYMSDPCLMAGDLPYVMDMEHARFQQGLLAHIRKNA